MPRRPPMSLRSIISNIHLLTGVSSFARWPLNLHFFAKEAHTTWINWIRSSDNPERPRLKILADYGEDKTEPWGIHALALDYAPMKEYVEKSHNVVDFERQGDCIHCKKEMTTGGGLYPMCPNEECEAMGHLTCWGDYALSVEEAIPGTVVPNNCSCPSCGGPIRWGDMMKELTLRTRDEKEVAKLLKKKKARTKKT